MADDEFDEAPAAGRANTAAAGPFVLAAALGTPEAAAEAREYLNKQSILADTQIENLRLENDNLRKLDEYEVSHLRWRRFNDQMKGALQILLVLASVSVVAAVAATVWNAAGSGGLVVEPFTVPPDLAQRGLTGEVVAARLLDRLGDMQAATHSQRAPQSYANYWGDDIKVQIPQTGISLGELDRFLKEKLGHPTHVTGEVVELPSGISVTARAGSGGNATVDGADIDRLIQRLSESVYRITQPYLYGVYLAETGRNEDAKAEFVALSTNGPLSERGWGYLGWSNAVELGEGEFARLAMLRKAVAYSPDLSVPRQNIVLVENDLSQPENAIRDSRIATTLLSSRDHGGIAPGVVFPSLKRLEGIVASNLGAFHDARLFLASVLDTRYSGSISSVVALLTRAEVGEHDLKSARAVLGSERSASVEGNPHSPWTNDDVTLSDDAWAQMLIDTEAANWRGVLDDGHAIEATFAKNPGLRLTAFARETPWIAYAQAHLDHISEAETMMAGTPADCHVCLLMRARILELDGKRAQAHWWLTRAIALQPSIPFAYSELGEMLALEGDLDGAIAEFKIANEKGPHFADPLEMWGEALMRQNRSDLALTKFEEAGKYAPNWGRLHLKWGEALGYAGRKDEAHKQYEMASTLDLSAADKSELARSNLPPPTR